MSSICTGARVWTGPADRALARGGPARRAAGRRAAGPCRGSRAGGMPIRPRRTRRSSRRWCRPARTACVTIVVSTVGRSSVELTAAPDLAQRPQLAPPSGSARAVRSCSSGNSRTFSIAITAWSAKVCSSAICLSVKGRISVRKTVMAPIGIALAHAAARPRVVRMPLAPDGGGDVRVLSGHLGEQVRNVDRRRNRTIVRPETDPRVIGLAGPASRLERTGRGGPRASSHGPRPGRSARSGPRTARAALSTMASITGCRSVGELEMTRRMSAVAVCCSSASVRSAFLASSSLNSRTFSMAMTAWAAKVSSSAICLSVKGRTSVRETSNTPTEAPSRSSGAARAVQA